MNLFNIKEFIYFAEPIFSNYTEIIFLGVVFLLAIYVFGSKFNRTKKIFSSIILFISVVLVILLLWIAFCAPHYFIDASDSLFRKGEVSNIGNAIGSLMNPFIAIAAAILTFMAFWVQYNANQKMVENDERLQTERQFYEMLKIHRESVQNLEWKILEAPSEYTLHDAKNIKGWKLPPPKYIIKNLDHVSYKGLHVLKKYHNELMIAFYTIVWFYSNHNSESSNNFPIVLKKHINFLKKRRNKKIFLVASRNILYTIISNLENIKKEYKLKIEIHGNKKAKYNELWIYDEDDYRMKIDLIENDKAELDEFWIYDEKKQDVTNFPLVKDLFYTAYEIFFEGLSNTSIDGILKNTLDCIKQYVNKFNQDDYDLYDLPICLKERCRAQGRCNVFEGHRDVLNSYYRHLYFTVKNVVESKSFKETEKKNYLKILRSQMTSEEQALLLFNWYAGYGTEWEMKSSKMENHFFTKFYMIHNIQLNDIKMVLSLDDWKYLFVNEFMKEKEWERMFQFVERKSKLNDKKPKSFFNRLYISLKSIHLNSKKKNT